MKRPIAAIPMPDVAPGAPATPPPVFMMVRPTELLVDETYQRDLSDASVRLIRRIVAEWDWRKFKAPVVAMTAEGPVVLDGQHTATAAASHQAITEIPVLVVEAAEQQQQAEAFVGINTTRLGITAAQLHFANIAAGDEAALAVDRVCLAAGVRVLRLPPARAVYKPGETIAVAAITGLVDRSGETTAIRVLRTLAAAGLGPVGAAHMRAVEHLITDPEFVELDADDLPRIIQAVGIDAAEREAKTFAATHGVQFWKALAATWFKARRARRKPVDQGRELTERSSPAGPENLEARQTVAVAATRESAPEVTASPRGPAAALRPAAADLAVAAARAAVPAPSFSGPGRR